MKGQLYVVHAHPTNAHDVAVGDFVSSGHDNDDYAIGFVNAVDLVKMEIEICLFSPREMPGNVIRVITEEFFSHEPYIMLDSICQQQPHVKTAWTDAIQRSVADNH